MTDHPETRVVWSELPASDTERAKSFYEALLQAPLTENADGPQPIWVLPYAGGSGTSGHIYEGKPAGDGNGPTVHLAVGGDLNAAKDRVEKAGGKVVSDNITIPAGTFFYAVDTEGNSIGIFGDVG